MSTIKIYTSEGVRYDIDQRKKHDKIADFFFGQVRLAVDTSGFRSKVIGFFRAKEASSGRSNQFYAVYTSKSDQNLLDEFKRGVRRKVENDLGLTLVSESDTIVFDHLGEVGRSRQNNRTGISDKDRTALELMCQRKERGTFKTSGHETAISVVQALVSDAKRGKIAISDGGSNSALSGYNVILEPDQNVHQSLKPVDNTEALMVELRKDVESQLVDRKISSIKDEIDDLKETTDLSESELRRKLKQSIPLLKRDPKKRGRAGAGSPNASGGPEGINYGSEDDSLSDELKNKVPLGIIAPIVIVLVLGVVLISGASCLGVDLAGVGGFVPICNDDPGAEFTVSPNEVNTSETKRHNLTFRRVNLNANESQFSIRLPEDVENISEPSAHLITPQNSTNITLSEVNTTSNNITIPFNVSGEPETRNSVTTRVSVNITWPDTNGTYPLSPIIDGSADEEVENASVTVSESSSETTPTDTPPADTSPTATNTPSPPTATNTPSPPPDTTPTEFTVSPNEVNTSESKRHNLTFRRVNLNASESQFSIRFPEDVENVSNLSGLMTPPSYPTVTVTSAPSVETTNNNTEILFSISGGPEIINNVTTWVSVNITWPDSNGTYTVSPMIDGSAGEEPENASVKVGESSSDITSADTSPATTNTPSPLTNNLTGVIPPTLLDKVSESDIKRHILTLSRIQSV